MRRKVLWGASASQRHRGFLCVSWRELGRKEAGGGRQTPQTPNSQSTLLPHWPEHRFQDSRGRISPAHRAVTCGISSMLPGTLHVEANTSISSLPRLFSTLVLKHLLWPSSSCISLRGARFSCACVRKQLSGPLLRTSCCV